MARVSANYRDRSVAITGASGYIGSVLVSELLRRGALVLSVDRRPSVHGSGVEHLIGDIREESCWREIVERASIIFHLAGPTSGKAAELNPDENFQATVMPLVHLAGAARALGRCPRVIFTSTATVYGFTSADPTSEEAIARPQTVYDQHKLAAEQRLAAAADLDSITLRLSNVYGAGPVETLAEDRGFLNRSASRAIAGQDLAVYGDGSYVRDFVHVDDVVRALVIAGGHEGSVSRCFNVGSGRGVAMRDALGLLARAAWRGRGQSIVVREADWPAESDPIDRRSFVADVSRIGAELGWHAAITLEEGIGSLMAWKGSEACAFS